MGPSSPFVEKNSQEPAYIAQPNGRRETLGFWLIVAEGKSPQNWEGIIVYKQSMNLLVTVSTERPAPLTGEANRAIMVHENDIERR
jgi:hypothetical protein